MFTRIGVAQVIRLAWIVVFVRVKMNLNEYAGKDETDWPILDTRMFICTWLPETWLRTRVQTRH